jgi:hypothetical protein
MRIGTVRPEEAKVFDQFAGYHRFHSEESQEPYGSLEIFWRDYQAATDDSEEFAAGWYWWACFPGCMPEGDPMGPFASSRAALQDADEWNPEFDETESES